MDVKDDGAYNLRELTMARAYGLLVHAEIECYFENIAKEVVLKSYKKWKLEKKSSHVLMSVTAFLNPKEQIPENVSNEKINKNEEGLIENRLKDCVSRYIGMIEKNNGIKETNLLKILLPLGIHLNDIDHTFLNSANSYTIEGSIKGLAIVSHNYCVYLASTSGQRFCISPYTIVTFIKRICKHADFPWRFSFFIRNEDIFTRISCIFTDFF